ncbi:MAG: tripartite tricarboxylate transporter TctB family protein [Gemmobacter sp.]
MRPVAPGTPAWADDRPTRRPGEIWFVAAFFVFSLWLLAHLGTEARWFARGVRFHSQPAFWPGVGIAGMALFSGLYLIVLLRSRAPSAEWRELLLWLRAFEYVLWYLAYAFLTPVLGYLPASVLVMVALILRAGPRSRGAVLAAAGFAVGMVVLFKSLLGVAIPGGRLYDLAPAGMRTFLAVYL